MSDAQRRADGRVSPAHDGELAGDTVNGRAHGNDIELVIFDLDGVLVDTQPAENAALSYLGSEMGLVISSLDADLMFSGKRLQQCISMLEEMSRCPAPQDAISIVRQKCEDLLGPGLDPIEGVEQALTQIRVRKIVASNSPRDIMERRLRSAGILHYFCDGLYSAYEANAWKPDPALFLLAAADNGVDGARCVVVEDSAIGIQAAVAAGMRVLQFSAKHISAGRAAAQHVRGVTAFSSMAALPDLITSAELGTVT